MWQRGLKKKKEKRVVSGRERAFTCALTVGGLIVLMLGLRTRLWPLTTRANSPEMLSMRLLKEAGGERCSCFPPPPPVPSASTSSFSPFAVNPHLSLAPPLVCDSSAILSLAFLETSKRHRHGR